MSTAAESSAGTSPSDLRDNGKVSLVIPAHNPDPVLLRLVRDLRAQGFEQIVVVNDGSGDESGDIFSQLKDIPGLVVLHHERNLGKGAALKTAFRHLLRQGQGDEHLVVTLDADGQHGIEDVLGVTNCGLGNPHNLVIGVRTFKQDVPWRSRFGNRLTRKVLQWTHGIDLQDTQSGLRCLPLGFAKATIEIPANRYEFELECILAAKKRPLSIIQYPIRTIYLDGNASSHFRPVVDSLRIYMVFARFLLVSMASFVVDITLFTVFHWLGGNILISTYAARLLSGSFNFYFNKHAAFRSNNQSTVLWEAGAYVILAFMIATASGLLVSWLTQTSEWPPPLLKVAVDTQLFIVNFLIQRFIIFRP